MQSVTSRIWTRVAMFISYDNNYYTTGTSTKFYLILMLFKWGGEYESTPSLSKLKVNNRLGCLAL